MEKKVIVIGGGWSGVAAAVAAKNPELTLLSWKRQICCWVSEM